MRVFFGEKRSPRKTMDLLVFFKYAVELLLKMSTFITFSGYRWSQVFNVKSINIKSYNFVLNYNQKNVLNTAKLRFTQNINDVLVQYVITTIILYIIISVF